MEYRFYFQEEVRSLFRETPEYEIPSMPAAGKWPNNWEWFYDIPDIKRDIKLSLKRAISFVALRLLRWCGATVNKGKPEYSYTVRYVDVNTKNVMDAIMRKLNEYDKRGIADGKMIVVGPKEFKELFALQDYWGPVQLMGQTQYAYSTHDHPYGARQTNYYILDTPIFVVPDFVGLAILPDFTGTATRHKRW